MKIRVAYSELVSGPGYNNRKMEAEVELEVNGDVQEAFDRAYKLVKGEVQSKLGVVQSGINLDELPF